jgi:Domain of unknown function (DUF4405)
VLLFGGFFVSTAPEATGIAVHEWVGLALILILLVHLACNWNWIVGTTRRILGRLPGETRFNHFLDLLLFAAMTLTMVSGVLDSESALPSLGIALKPDHFWRYVHGIFAYTTIAIVGVHVGMHGDWILSKLKRAGREDPARRAAFLAGLWRFLLVGAVSAVVALAALQLGRTPWADGIRSNTDKYIREHPRPAEPRPQVVNNHRSPRNLARQLVGPVLPVLLMAGVPGGLTFLILRKRR